MGMRGRLLLGILMALVGAVWIGQGLGILQGRSFMVGDVRWAIAGGVMVVIGAALLVDTRRRRD